MKRGSLIGVTLVIALILFIPFSARAQFIDGWWEAKMALKNGDLVTAQWDNFRGAGLNMSFLYIFGSSENSYAGTAYYIERDAAGGSYVLENTFSVYTKNYIAVLTGPASVDQDGNLIEGSTMVLQILGPPGNPGQLKGYYTKYDSRGGQDVRMVKMGSISARRRALELIPPEVFGLIP